MASVLTDNTAAIKSKLKANVKNALHAVGKEATALIRDQMLSGYTKAPYDTGNLFRSIDYYIKSADTVAVGTEVDYGKYVHDGTYKMAARPFMRDALLSSYGKDRLKSAAESEIGDGL